MAGKYDDMTFKKAFVAARKAKGKQFVKQPKKIAEKTRKFRANEGGAVMKLKEKVTGKSKGGMAKRKAKK